MDQFWWRYFVVKAAEKKNIWTTIISHFGIHFFLSLCLLYSNFFLTEWHHEIELHHGENSFLLVFFRDNKIKWMGKVRKSVKRFIDDSPDGFTERSVLMELSPDPDLISTQFPLLGVY